MATLSVHSVTHSDATVNIGGLQYNANEYDYFNFQFYVNGQSAVYARQSINLSTKTFNLIFTTPWSGWNYFAPNTNYTLEVYCVYNGTQYNIGTTSFKTSSISSPSGTITPTVYTKIRDQVTSQNCVACSLATAMDRIRAIQVGEYENYSSSYIYGDGGDEYGINFFEAVEQCSNKGSPRWDLVGGSFEFDNSRGFSASRTIYNNAETYVRNHAKKQAFSGYYGLDFYDTDSVYDAVSNYGTCMINIKLPYNFYYVGTSGIVPQPDEYSGANHSVQIIGLTTKNSKKHWIIQNSWGTGWGAGGLGYLPYDWGCNDAPPPSGSDGRGAWTLDCYAVMGNTLGSIPSEPYNVTAVANPPNKQMTVSWSSSVSGATYTVLLSQSGSNMWYVHGRTTNKILTVFPTNYGFYDVRVLSSVNDFYSDYSNRVTVEVSQSAGILPNPTLDITKTIKNPTSISITINPVENADTYYAQLWNLNETTLIYNYSSSGYTFTFNGLSENTTYIIKIACSGEGYTDSGWSSYQATTIVNGWEWLYEKVSGQSFNITATEWLNFINKIDSVRNMYGLPNYGFTRTSSYFLKGQPFYYWMFRQAASAINDINGQVPSNYMQVSSGDKIYASYFNILKNILNNAIIDLM